MFGDSLLTTRNRQPRPNHWVTLATSLIIHSFIIAAMFIAPLMDADAQMPSLTIEHIFLGTPPPPALPPPPRGGGESHHPPAGPAVQEPQAPEPKMTPNRLIIPVVVPEEIPKEELTFDLGPASSQGIEGAATGWEAVETLPDLTQIIGVDHASKSPAKIRLEFTLSPPKLLFSPPPEYPAAALKSHTQGTVKVEAETDIYGKVIRIQAVSGHPLLLRAAENAVKKWRYEPYILNGMPRPVKFIVSVNFVLNK